MERFFTLGRPCFYVVQSDDTTFASLSLQLVLLGKEHVIRKIMGNRSKDVQSFYGEIAAALQFPYYFGKNWWAFEECITDLDWAEGDAYLILVHDACLLLSEAPAKSFHTLLTLFEAANEEWLTPNLYIPRERQPTPFHVLFQCTKDEIAEFSQRLDREDVSYEQVGITLDDAIIKVRAL